MIKRKQINFTIFAVLNIVFKTNSPNRYIGI